jgi:23S rRNA (cytosine1962-C5)-methyltransferase
MRSFTHAESDADWAHATLSDAAANRMRHGSMWADGAELLQIDGTPEPGRPLVLRDRKGEVLGYGDVDPKARPAIRRFALPDEDPRAAIPIALRAALERRRTLVDAPRFCRMVHDDGDGLPGLTIDRYDRHFVMHPSTRAMEARAQAIARLLIDVTQTDSVLMRRDGPMRARAGLPILRPEVLFGAPPRWARVLELGSRITTDLFEGRSMGYPYILREVRRSLIRLAPGQEVLDVRCGVGHLFVHAAQAGAKQVLAFTGDEDELDLARENIEANGLLNRVTVHLGEAPDILSGIDRRFDLVLVDAREHDSERLRPLLCAAMRATRSRGQLLVAVRHPELPEQQLEPTIAEACEQEGRSCVLLVKRSAPPDFPRLISAPMNAGLTAVVLEVH